MGIWCLQSFGADPGPMVIDDAVTEHLGTVESVQKQLNHRSGSCSAFEVLQRVTQLCVTPSINIVLTLIQAFKQCHFT